MNKSTKLIAAAAGSLALVASVSAGLAYADPTPSPSPSQTPKAAPKDKPSADGQKKHADQKTQGKHRSLAARSIHGEATLGGPKHRVIVFQRGVVDAVNGTSITVTSSDGYKASYTIGDKTRVRQGKEAGSVKDLAAKDKVRVVALKDGGTVTAKVVRERIK